MVFIKWSVFVIFITIFTATTIITGFLLVELEFIDWQPIPYGT